MCKWWLQPGDPGSPTMARPAILGAGGWLQQVKGEGFVRLALRCRCNRRDNDGAAVRRKEGRSTMMMMTMMRDGRAGDDAAVR